MRWSIRLPEPRALPIPTVEEFVTCTQAVEDGGWDAVWVTDHPFPLVTPGHHGHHAWEPFTSLAVAAGMTSRVLLHSNLVVLPYRNPFLVAKSAATLQYLSGGRFVLVVGGGYLRPEFEALGADHDQRGKRLREGVDAMEAAWKGEPLVAEGADWVAAGNTMLPASRPHRVLRGGNAPAAIRHAARAFDGWAPVEATSESAAQTKSSQLAAGSELKESIERLRQTAAEAGRPRPEVWVTRSVEEWFGRPRAEIRAQVEGLEEVGVDWLSVWIAPLEGVPVDDYLRRLDELAQLVR